MKGELMSRNKLGFLLFVVCFTSGGCLSLEAKPDPSKFFALTSLPRSGQSAANSAGTSALALGIGPIKLPGYLDRPQVVSRVSENRFVIAQNDRWAEPLEENFSRVLSQNLSMLLHTDRMVVYPWERSQQPKYQVQVELLRFEPNVEQTVELWARWSIIDSTKKMLSVKDSYLSRPTKDKSVEASVASMSEAVADLSREISSALRTLSLASSSQQNSADGRLSGGQRSAKQL